MDPRLDQDQAELRVLVAAAALEVLADGDRLLDHAVEVLGDFGRKALRFQDADDLRPRDVLDLADRKLVAEDKPDPRGGVPFLASLQICSQTSSGVYLFQGAGARVYGMAERDIPLPFECMRPMALSRAR